VLDGAATVLLGAGALDGVGVTVAAAGVLDGRAIGAGTVEEGFEAGADVVVE
jgi:hypothetical protein